MSLEQIIYNEIERHHRGRENAIKRGELLAYCQLWESEMTDRELRNIYSRLSVCTCEDGIFFPIRPEELEEFRIYLAKKAGPMFERWRMVAQAHPHLVKDGSEQLKLFQGG